MIKINTVQMEVALAMFFDYRQCIIVPQISWGMVLHECDLLVMSKSGYATEVEIKISKQDLIVDAKKRHGHLNEKISRLYFAIPKVLEKYIDCIPARAGIIVVAENFTYTNGFRRGIKVLRQPLIKARKDCYKFSDKEIFQMARLGTMRIWALKQKILKIKKKGK